MDPTNFLKGNAMAARRGSRTQTTQLNSDAKEFGVGVRCGGWRLGLLVARNVAHGGSGGRPTAENRSPENGSEKVSISKFAELAGVSKSHVKYYLDAWELAAKAGLVPSSDQITPGEDDIDIEADSIEVEDNPRTHWTHFYQLAKTPQKESKEPKTKEKKQDSVESEIDEDFGISSSDEPMTEDEAAEADSSIQRNQLLEILESTQAIVARLSRIDSVSDNSILLQIASAALDLNTTANAMAVQVDSVDA